MRAEQPRMGRLDRMMVGGQSIPAWRTEKALQDGVEKKLIFIARGGLGDQACAEPTIRYAFNHFKDCEISLAAHDGLADLFTHLPFKRVFDLREIQPMWERYMVFETICDVTAQDTFAHFSDQYFTHTMTHCVDYASTLALRCHLPISEKQIQLTGVAPEGLVPSLVMNDPKAVFIHAGRHWQSKTFPAKWWNSLLAWLKEFGATPVLIGADRKDTGVVKVDDSGCINLVNKTNVKETIWLLQRAKVLLTNDSAPLHLASSGNAHIGFVATIKHPDYITHWRNGQWGWRMKNFSRGGAWEHMDMTPFGENPGYPTVEKVPVEHLNSWLPDTQAMAEWAVERLREC